MNLKLPIGRDSLRTLAAWAAEIRRSGLISGDDFSLSTWVPSLTGNGTLVLSGIETASFIYCKLGEILLFETHLRYSVAGVGNLLFLSMPYQTKNRDSGATKACAMTDGATSGFGYWRAEEGGLVIFRAGGINLTAGVGAFTIQGFVELA